MTRKEAEDMYIEIFCSCAKRISACSDVLSSDLKRFMELLEYIDGPTLNQEQKNYLIDMCESLTKISKLFSDF